MSEFKAHPVYDLLKNNFKNKYEILVLKKCRSEGDKRIRTLELSKIEEDGSRTKIHSFTSWYRMSPVTDEHAKKYNLSEFDRRTSYLITEYEDNIISETVNFIQKYEQ